MCIILRKYLTHTVHLQHHHHSMPKFDYHKQNPTSSIPTKLLIMHPPKRSNRGRKASNPTPPTAGPARVTKRSSPPAHRPVKLTLRLNPPKPLVEAEAALPFNSRSSSKSTLMAEDSDRTLSYQDMIFGSSSPKASGSSDEGQVHDAAIILFGMRNNVHSGRGLNTSALGFQTVFSEQK